MRAAAVMAVGALVLAACAASPLGDDAVEPVAAPSPPANPTSSTVTSVAPSTTLAAALPTTSSDTTEADVAAWASTAAGPGALYLRRWVDATELTLESQVVILGRVLGVGPVRTVQGDAEGDVVSFGSLRVEVLDVVSGTLQNDRLGVGDEIRLEMFRMPVALPTEPALMFLAYTDRHEERGIYGTVHPAGIVIDDGRGSVRAPVYEAQFGDSGALDLDSLEHQWLTAFRSRSFAQVLDYVRAVDRP